MFLSDRFQGEKACSLPELFTGHLGGYIFARRVYLWRFVTLGTVEEDLSYRPAMCSLLTIFVKMIRWYDTMKTSCTLRAVHHSITLELWFSALQASAGVVAKPTWTDCCESWGTPWSCDTRLLPQHFCVAGTRGALTRWDWRGWSSHCPSITFKMIIA